jgi:hypothetical protein
MNKEFVPYAESLALKELGFDEPCLGRWISITEWEKPNGEVRLQLCTKVDAWDKNQCHAPLYQQAFRWFMEKYGLVGLIEIGTQEYSFIVFDVKKDSRKYTSNMNGTYEEAELACLRKLIELANEKR